MVMAGIPTHPKIWGDLRLVQLHITGASYITPGDGPSIPNRIILGHKGQRWELVIADVFETDKTGKRITPAGDPPAILLPFTERIKKLEELLKEGLEVNGALHSALDGAAKRMKELEDQLAAERKLSADRLVAYDIANTELTEAKGWIKDALDNWHTSEAKLADREAAIKAFEKENAKLRVEGRQNQAEICAACRKAAEDAANGVPLPPEPNCKTCELAGMAIFPCVKCSHAFGASPEPDEDRIRELQEKRREDQERRHDAARQHAAEGG